MKKILALILSLVCLFACSAGAVAEAHNLNNVRASIGSVAFSFDKVSGKKGDLVTVNFYLDTENSGINVGEIQFIYNTQLLEEAPDPEEETFITKGEVLQNANFASNDKNLKVAFTNEDGIKRKGVFLSFTYRLLQDVDQPEKVMSCKISLLCHYDASKTFQQITVTDYWEQYPYSLDKDSMWGNNIEFSATVDSAEMGERVRITFSMNQTQSYLKELDLKIIYDHEKLRLNTNTTAYGEPFTLGKELVEGEECTFDLETGIFHYRNEKGLTSKLDFKLCFEILVDVTEKTTTPIEIELLQPPVHSNIEDFEYRVFLQNGAVIIEPPAIKQKTYRVPAMVDDVLITEIGEGAFVEQPYVILTVTVSNYVTTIHPNAFVGAKESFVLRGGEGSAAQAFAEEYGITFQVAPEVADVVTNTDMVTSTDVYAEGDLDKDGYFTAKDALEILGNAVGKKEFTLGKKQAADINKDGKINAKDALVVLRRGVGKVA